MSSSKRGNPPGESGHQGHDRQPGKEIARADQATPEPNETASAEEVRKRSKAATGKANPKQPDPLRPRPAS